MLADATPARLLHIPIVNSNSSHFLQDSRGKEIEISRMPRLTSCETNFHNPISDTRSSTRSRSILFFRPEILPPPPPRYIITLAFSATEHDRSCPILSTRRKSYVHAIRRRSAYVCMYLRTCAFTYFASPFRNPRLRVALGNYATRAAGCKR